MDDRKMPPSMLPVFFHNLCFINDVGVMGAAMAQNEQGGWFGCLKLGFYSAARGVGGWGGRRAST